MTDCADHQGKYVAEKQDSKKLDQQETKNHIDYYQHWNSVSHDSTSLNSSVTRNQYRGSVIQWSISGAGPPHNSNDEHRRFQSHEVSQKYGNIF